MKQAQLRRRLKSEGYELKDKVLEGKDITYETYVKESIEIKVKRQDGRLLEIKVTNNDVVLYIGDNMDKAKYWMRKAEDRE